MDKLEADAAETASLREQVGMLQEDWNIVFRYEIYEFVERKSLERCRMEQEELRTRLAFSNQQLAISNQQLAISKSELAISNQELAISNQKVMWYEQCRDWVSACAHRSFMGRVDVPPWLKFAE